MFAPPVAKATTAAASKNTSPLHRAVAFGRSPDDAGAHEVDAAARPSCDPVSAPTVSWNFAAIAVNSPGTTAASRPFKATFRAIVRGRQSDSISADRHTSPAESEPRAGQSGVLQAGEPETQRKDGEPVPIGTLPSISGEQNDSITSHLNYNSSIRPDRRIPADFGRTWYEFIPKTSHTIIFLASLALRPVQAVRVHRLFLPGLR